MKSVKAALSILLALTALTTVLGAVASRRFLAAGSAIITEAAPDYGRRANPFPPAAFKLQSRVSGKVN